MNVEFSLDANADERLINISNTTDLCSDDEGDEETAKQLFAEIKPYPEHLINYHSINEPPIDLKAKSDLSKKVNELMKKSVIQPGFEQLHRVTSKVSRRALVKERRKEREKTKGSNWYHLPAPEMTSELKNDLDLLKMRSVLDPKHFYKHNDITHEPKYLQVGRVVEGPADFYNGRLPKSQRKKTLVDELMADFDARAYQRRKYKEIVNDSAHKKFRKAHSHAKKLKKNKRK